MAGARPGERRGGRQAGVPNKVTRDIRALAQKYTSKAIKRLAHLAENAESEAAQVAAIKEILDRAYGKSKQSTEVSGPDEAPIGIAVRFVGGDGDEG